MNKKELDLLHRYLSGTILPEEIEPLEELLGNSAEARKTLRSLATVESKCQTMAESLQEPIKPDRPNRIPHRLSLFAVGAVALAILFAGFGWMYSQVNSSKGIARIIRIDGENSQLTKAKALQKGEHITLEQGMIEMAFLETGVHVIATAPLDIRIDSSRQVFLTEGEIKLHVPPQGVGFVVETLDRKITDLGTSFVVTTRKKESKVLVLDGQITVANRDGSGERLMAEGDLANFVDEGKINLRSKQPSEVPELSIQDMTSTTGSLPGIIFGFDQQIALGHPGTVYDYIAPAIMPLIKSGFRDRSCLDTMKKGASLRFTGVAGTYNQFPDRTGLPPYRRAAGWLAWYHGRVKAPLPGRYRFWGYADNQLLVAVDGKPVFEGSRYDSVLRRDLKVPRFNHPAMPCLNAVAGFASGPWIEVGGQPVQLDILFGETKANCTSALLLVEREGATYEETFWGQPKWALFLTEKPAQTEIAELEKLRLHMEEKLMGSFSISEDAFWSVQK